MKNSKKFNLDELINDINSQSERDRKIYIIKCLLSEKFNGYDEVLVKHYLLINSTKSLNLQKLILLLHENYFTSIEEFMNYIK
jgi:hypothetical protein